MAGIQRVIIDVLMIDGTEHRNIVSTLRDQERLSQTARRHKWGNVLETDPGLAIRFMAWAALSRLGRFTGTYDEFLDAAEAIASQEPSDVDPTAPASPVD